MDCSCFIRFKVLTTDIHVVFRHWLRPVVGVFLAMPVSTKVAFCGSFSQVDHACPRGKLSVQYYAPLDET